MKLNDIEEVLPTEEPVVTATEAGVVQVPQPADEALGSPIWMWLLLLVLAIALVWSLIAKRNKPRRRRLP